MNLILFNNIMVVWIFYLSILYFELEMLDLSAVLLSSIIEQIPQSISTHFSCHLATCVIAPLCTFYCINVLNLPRDVCNAILIASGIAIQLIAFGPTGLIVYSYLLVSILSYLSLFLRAAQFALILSIPVTAYYMLSLHNSTDAGRCGALITFLTLFMKAYSLAHDTRIQKLSISKNIRVGLVSSKFISSLLVSKLEYNIIPNIFEYLGYVYSPGNVLLGPFVTLKEHQTIMLMKKINIKRIQVIVTSSLLSLVLSAAGLALITGNLPGLSDDRNILLTFIGIRCLKYSLNSLQELSLVSSGTQQISSLGIFNQNRAAFFVSKPLLIELPRSFIGIVFNWNLPLFSFVRSYVYFPCHALGRPIAALISVFITGILFTIELKVSLGTHNISLGFVHALSKVFLIILITLFLAFCENCVRDRLAERLSLCVKSRSCPTPCEHNTERYLVPSINLLSTLVCIYTFNSLGSYFSVV